MQCINVLIRKQWTENERLTYPLVQIPMEITDAQPFGRERGTPVHDLVFTGPDWALTDILGTRAIGAAGLGVFSLFFWFNRAYRSHPMPVQLEAFKMAEQTGAAREMRGWFWALLLAGGVGMLCAFWVMLACYYQYGGLAKVQMTFGPEAWDRYAG
jgi:hypothetical protein